MRLKHQQDMLLVHHTIGHREYYTQNSIFELVSYQLGIQHKTELLLSYQEYFRATMLNILNVINKVNLIILDEPER